jgi:hypothetical protein
MEKLRSVSHSGVSIIAPAWEIIDLLKQPALKEKRKTYENDCIKYNKYQTGDYVLACTEHQNANPIKHDFDKHEFHNPFDIETEI